MQHTRCEFWQDEGKTINHVFLECRYTEEIWEIIPRKMQIRRRLEGWIGEMWYAIRSWRGKNDESIAGRLSWTTYTYVI